MAHVPKKATQHGLFTSGMETAPPTLKPGQDELYRRGMYSFEAKRAFAATTSLALDLKTKSEGTHMHNSTPDDYKNPAKPSRPSDNHVSSGIDYAAKGTTQHWKSVYQAAGEEATACMEERGVAKGISCKRPDQPPAVVSRNDFSTLQSHHYGKYGSNPRDRIAKDQTRLLVHPNSLNRGTTRGTEHIPGYQGFIAANPSGPHSARASSGRGIRSMDKTNIGDVFHTNLVGYAGHAPKSHSNDFGGRRPTELTTAGRDYAGPLRTARF